ncbi:MAG: photosynthetic complex assembly protein PuhC [Pseudomonadota bacterium]
MATFIHLPDDHRHDVPKVPLYAAGALVLITVLLVFGVRLTGVGELRTPRAPVVAERLLHFADKPEGGVQVHDARDGQLVARVAPGEEGFLRGALRGLARERKRERIGPETPFRLSSRADGRLLLEDPATARLIDLGAFGPGNVAVFTRMLEDVPPTRAAAASSSPPPSPPRT